jgi:FkbM family methyltransferase
MSIPPYKIYYSQNREDLILAGILRTVSLGFYVDVGANHPESDSVTKLFYDKGWSGVNIEPDERLNAELCKQRPRDINIKTGLSSQAGTLLFRSYESNSSLSTFSSELKHMYEELHLHPAYEEKSVAVTTLGQILNVHRPIGDIHFLKVDVEGLELEVLLGNRWDKYRPWVICLERNMCRDRIEAISAFLTAWRYVQVFFDGINDYFVAGERRAIWDEFSYGREMVLEGVPVSHLLSGHLGSNTSKPDHPSGLREATGTSRQAVSDPPASHIPVSSTQALLALEGEEFVRAAYATVLNRLPDPDGFKHHLSELNAGVPKISVLSRMLNSEEGQRRPARLRGYRRAWIQSFLKFS